jgi:hypothetical protein
MILWAVAAMIAGGLMFAAWTGPHQSVSNISRWAMRLRIRDIPFWLSARDADRWAFRGGLVAMVLLLGAVWFIPPHRSPDAPVSAPGDSGKVDTDKGALAPPPAGGDRSVVNRNLGAYSQIEAGPDRGFKRRSGGRSIFLGDRRISQSRRIPGAAPPVFCDGCGRQDAERNKHLS